MKVSKPNLNKNNIEHKYNSWFKLTYDGDRGLIDGEYLPEVRLGMGEQGNAEQIMSTKHLKELSVHLYHVALWLEQEQNK